MSSFLTADVQLGTLLVVNNVSRSRDFYRDVLGQLRTFRGPGWTSGFDPTRTLGACPDVPSDIGRRVYPGLTESVGG